MMWNVTELDCPFPNAMRRLKEVHRFWHRALENYGDPDEYLPDLNAAIQSSRNTTFALQNEKAGIPEYDAWYSSWQAALRADPIMKWLNDSRVRIVHQGDIEASSTTTIWPIFDYFDAAVEVASDLDEGRSVPLGTRLSVPSLTPMGDFADLLRESGVPEVLVREATVSYERRWEDKMLPGRELNGALAHGYAVLANLLVSAHEQAGVLCVHEYGCGSRSPGGSLTTTVKPPTCMATTRKLRTRILEAHSGLDPEDGILQAIEFDPNRLEAAMVRYLGEDGRPVALHVPIATSLIDLLPSQIEQAKAILRSGEDHGWFVIFFQGTTPVANRFLAAANAQQKRELAKEVAQLALAYEATGVLEVGEAWMSPSPKAGEFVRPAAHPARQEAVVLCIATIGGREVQAIVPFTRPDGVGGKVLFGDTTIFEDGKNNFLAPLRAAWAWKKRTYPSEPGASFVRRTSQPNG